jgi:isocitrate dehydrogenase
MAVFAPITIAYGDGIGPEIMSATLRILKAAGAKIEPETIEIGEKVYLQGYTSGISPEAWESLLRTKVLLKGPITTPQGGGYKSLNVTIRKALDLYANVRPCMTYRPYVPAKCDHMDIIIVRENEEDMYAGIEYRQTKDVYECLKIVTRKGSKRIIQYAFEHAKKYNRKKVTCFTKDNIMKMTDGLFHQVFNEVAKDYPDIHHEHYIVDIGTALLATQPERFDVIVTLNLYGDIISDVAAQVAGSVGLGGSANIGDFMAMFEAIHGSAPDIAHKNIANPSGLVHAAIQMLIHIGQPDVAAVIENAWLKTLEDGIHTGDIFSPTLSKEKVGTDAFADAVIHRLGQLPTHFKPVDYQSSGPYTKITCYGLEDTSDIKKELVGIDVFIDNKTNMAPEKLAEKLSQIKGGLKLVIMTSRGLKIWPTMPNAILPDVSHCCFRFQSSTEINGLKPVTADAILALLAEFNELGLDVIKTENLYTFDGKPGFSLAAGQ